MPKSINPLPLLHKKSSSPFSSAQRRKAGVPRQSSHALKSDSDGRLQETGLIPSLAPSNVSQDVVSLVRHVRSSMWAEIPERAAGMGSERISEVLNYRKALPPIVTTAHLFALSKSTTATEREIATLLARGEVRRVVVPARGKGGSTVGDGLVLVTDLLARVRDDPSLDDNLAHKYTQLLKQHPTSATIPILSFSAVEVQTLVRFGLLTTPSALSSSLNFLFSHPNTTSSGRISSAGTTAATGTLAAIGGSGAVHESGGSGSTLSTSTQRNMASGRCHDMTVSLPTTGAYLKLITEARAHLLALLKQISPSYREATRELLREKWNGNILGSTTSQAKRARGEFTGVLPGQTKKWKSFYGLEFEWILAECVGGGLVELFDTGSVGLGVRAT